MAALSSLDKQYFEDLFGMASGYVLDFSNRTFDAFFLDTIGEYPSNLPNSSNLSKANRLRAFWSSNGDQKVGKVLEALLARWAYIQRVNNPLDNEVYKKANNVVFRLLGKTIDPKTKQADFLGRDFGNISFLNLPIENSLISILEKRVKEMMNCLHNKENSPLAVIILAGSILEGTLLAIARNQPREFNQANSSPRNNTGSVKPLPEWSLSSLIDVAYDIGILELDVKRFSHSLRSFRNYIHPYEQMASGFNPNEDTAKISVQVLKAAVNDLRAKLIVHQDRQGS